MKKLISMLLCVLLAAAACLPAAGFASGLVIELPDSTEFSGGELPISEYPELTGPIVFSPSLPISPTLPLNPSVYPTFTTVSKGQQINLYFTTDETPQTSIPALKMSSHGIVTAASIDANAATLIAVGEGSVTVTCTFDTGESVSSVITVVAPPRTLVLDSTSVTLNVGESRGLNPHWQEDGTAATGLNFYSSNPSVAIVDNYGVISAKAPGTAVISVNGYSNTCSVIVKSPDAGRSVTFSQNPLPVGNTANVYLTDSYGNKLTPDYYGSSKPSVASVNASGVVTAYAAGSTVITCIYGSNTYTATLNVVAEPSWIKATPASSIIRVNETTQINVTSDVGSSFTYTVVSYSPSIAQVNASTTPATITGRSEGTTTILVTASNGKSANFQIVVSGIAPSPTSPTPPSGYATVIADGSVNMRSSPTTSADNIITQIPNGKTVGVVTYGPTWCLVQYGGYQGYVMTQYLNYGPTPTTPPSTGITATVIADGSVNMRSSPTTSADNIITQIPSGKTIDVVTKGVTWSQVRYNGYTGYVMSQYLRFNGITPTPPTPPTPGTIVCYGIVTTASGSLNLRSGASTASAILTRIPRNAYVDVYEKGISWCRVGYGSWVGYVMTHYLTFASTKPSTPVTPVTPVTPSTGVAQVVTASGSLNLRISPYYGAAILTRIPQYAFVNVTNYGASWCQVTYGGFSGYVMTSFLSFNGSSVSPSQPVNTGMTAIAVTPTGALNLRAEAYYGATILTRIPQYATVRVLQKGASWCKVTYGNFTGYVMTQYLKF